MIVRSLISRTAVRTALASAVLLADPPALPAQTPGAMAKARSLVSTWNVLVTVRNCQTGAALGPAFPTMVAFAEGGTMSSQDTALSPALRSPSMGLWRHTTGQSYRATTHAFLFTAAGAWNGTHRIAQAIEMRGDDEFEGTAAVTIFDARANPVMQGCSTSTARRLEE